MYQQQVGAIPIGPPCHGSRGPLDGKSLRHDAIVPQTRPRRQLRNGLVVGSSHAVIGVGGSWGTLSEIALAVRPGKREAT